MSSTEERKPNYRNRIMWLGVFVIVLFGGYSAGWFYVAGKLEAMASAGHRRAQPRRHRRPTAPIRWRAAFRSASGIYCDSVRFEDAPQKVAASAAAFRSLAQVYDPFHIVAELDSPARISAPTGSAFAFDWANLRASARLSMDFPEQADAVVTSTHRRRKSGRIGGDPAFQRGQR